MRRFYICLIFVEFVFRGRIYFSQILVWNTAHQAHPARPPLAVMSHSHTQALLSHLFRPRTDTQRRQWHSPRAMSRP
jgi:hypothetical protein